MTIEEFVTLMKGIESLVVSLAVLIGGGWAWYTFRALGERNRAKAEIENLELRNRKGLEEIEGLQISQQKLELEVQKLEQEARAGGVIEISIEASQQTLPNDSSCYISVTVEIVNKGKRNTRLIYGEEKGPLFVYAVDTTENGALSFRGVNAYPVPVGRSPNVPSPSVNVRAGGRETVPFFVRVDSAGLYLLVFTARLSDEEQEIAKRLGFKFPGNWVAKQYFIVQ